MMKKLRRELVILLLPFISLLLRLWARTIRWQNRYDFEKDRRKIYALWHRYTLAFPFYAIDRGIVALVSRFRDGDIADGFLRRFGFETVRGSAEEGREGKGGRFALLKLMKLLKEGENIVITVDGPKGPPFKAKDGVIFLAQKTGAVIIPVCVKFEKFFCLNTWDRFVIPYPFTKAQFLAGKEIRVSPEDTLEDKRRELEEELLRLEKMSFGNPG
jgi:lysophospholipid acyltransferase (LPLAT)-like uncharacterized protein